jgi:ATP-dependent RNA helicase DeaD
MAFAIPALQRLDVQTRGVQVLILCPTRELAIQVCEEIHKLTAHMPG